MNSGLCYNIKVMEGIKNFITKIWACICFFGNSVWKWLKIAGKRINSLSVGDKVCALAVVFILVMIIKRI